MRTRSKDGCSDVATPGGARQLHGVLPWQNSTVWLRFEWKQNRKRSREAAAPPIRTTFELYAQHTSKRRPHPMGGVFSLAKDCYFNKMGAVVIFRNAMINTNHSTLMEVNTNKQ